MNSQIEPEQLKIQVGEFFKNTQDQEIGEVHIFSRMRNGYREAEIPKLCENTVFDYKYAYIFDNQQFPDFEPEMDTTDVKVYVFENSRFLETNTSYFVEETAGQIEMRDERLL